MSSAKSKLNKIIACLAILMMMFGLTGTCYAFVTSSGQVKFESGGVNISVKTYRLAFDKSIVEAPEEMYLSSFGKVSYIPKITNYAEDVYIRAKIDAEGTREEHPLPLTSLNDHLYGTTDQWTKIGGYYYYKEPVKKDETIDLCEGFYTIPAIEEALFFKANVTAEAIQSANVNPDFNSETPWGNVAIETSQIGEDYEIYRVAPTKTEGIRVVYEGKTSKFVTNADKFFNGFGELMPGDTYKDKLTFKTGSGRAKLYFKALAEDTKLTNALTLKIVADGKTFYDGKMFTSKMRNYKQILTLNKSAKNIEFEISMPAELMDEYQRLDGEEIFYFKVEEIKDSKSPKTGDANNLLTYSLVLAFAGAGLYFIAKRKDEKVNG